jgi:hypothetical protein
MTLDKFVQTLRPMLKNPNALTTDGRVLYLYTNDREIIAFDTGSTVERDEHLTSPLMASSDLGGVHV